MPSSLRSSLVLLLIAAVLSLTTAQAPMRNVLQFNTSEADVVQFQCTELTADFPFNPRCEFTPRTCDGWSCTGSTNQMTYCDSEFFVPGRVSDSYRLEDCDLDNTAQCDGTCTCVTGRLDDNRNFVPDGRNCTIVGQEEGTLEPIPTPEPTAAPTEAPSIDPSTAVVYNATNVNSSQLMFFYCEAPMVFCEVTNGLLSSGFGIAFEDGTAGRGWSRCEALETGNLADACLITCSPECACSLGLFEDADNITDLVEGLDGECIIADETLAPTPVPTLNPAAPPVNAPIAPTDGGSTGMPTDTGPGMPTEAPAPSSGVRAGVMTMLLGVVAASSLLLIGIC